MNMFESKIVWQQVSLFFVIRSIRNSNVSSVDFCKLPTPLLTIYTLLEQDLK